MASCAEHAVSAAVIDREPVEPGTAFRPVPPDIIEPWFEDDGPLPAQGTAYRLVPDA
jgi:hypothetical protein